MSNKHQKLSLAAREMQIKTTVSYQYTPVRMAKINKTDHAKYWPGCIEIETLLHCLWKYKMAQQPWKKFGYFFKMLENMIYPFYFWVFTQD